MNSADRRATAPEAFRGIIEQREERSRRYLGVPVQAFGIGRRPRAFCAMCQGFGHNELQQVCTSVPRDGLIQVKHFAVPII